MIRAGFLDAEAKRNLIELARDGTAEHRLARRAKNWTSYRDAVTDNFRVINPRDFRVVA